MLSDINTKIKISPFAAMSDPIYQRNRQLAKYQVDENQALLEQTKDKVAAQQTMKTEVPRLTALETSRIGRDITEATIAEQKALQEKKHAWGREQLEKEIESSQKGQLWGSIIGMGSHYLQGWETGKYPVLNKVLGTSKFQEQEQERKELSHRQNIVLDKKLYDQFQSYNRTDPEMALDTILDIEDPWMQRKAFNEYRAAHGEGFDLWDFSGEY